MCFCSKVRALSDFRFVVLKFVFVLKCMHGVITNYDYCNCISIFGCDREVQFFRIKLIIAGIQLFLRTHY
jgi:hypothetical protein